MVVSKCLHIISNVSYITDPRYCIESVAALVTFEVCELFVVARILCSKTIYDTSL